MSDKTEVEVMGTQLILPKPKNQGASLVISKVQDIAAVLPTSVERAQFFGSALAELNGLTKECTTKSMAMAVWNCAVVGWVPGPALGHAYFIPYWNKQQGVNICTLVPGYKGFIDLVMKNRFLKSVHTDVVLRGEEFRQWKDISGPQIHHEVPLERELNREAVIAAYCQYATSNGGYGITVVTRKELDKVDSGENVWKSDYVAMAKKTAVRRASKEWSLTRQLSAAVRLDEMADAGEYQDIGAMPVDVSGNGESTPSFDMGEQPTVDLLSRYTDEIEKQTDPDELNQIGEQARFEHHEQYMTDEQLEAVEAAIRVKLESLEQTV